MNTTAPPDRHPAPQPHARAPRRPTAGRRPMGVRLALLLGGGFSLIAGLDAALLQLGVGAPVTTERLASAHGMLMALGFVGTLIALERAVALGRGWAFASPAALGLGGIALVSPLPPAVAGGVLTVGTVLLAVIFIPLWRRRRDAAVLVQSLGAVGAVGAALLYTAGLPSGAFLGWLIAFVVLVIAGERMELARLGRTGGGAEQVALAAAVSLLAAIVLQLLFDGWGTPVLGVALLVVVAALVRVDIATTMVRATGLPRFSALCLIAGYVWLAVAGLVLALAAHPFTGGAFDAVVHAVMLGFTMSMIFAHAPVILPAVLRRPLPYHPAMYLPAALLHAALAVRVVGGDLRGAHLAWQVGGVGTVAAVIAFVLTAVTASVTASVTARRRPPDAPARRPGTAT